jgi:glycosyltransferase involved in cell wall biosynthesis
MFKHGMNSGCGLDWSFYCALGREGCLDEEVMAHGGRVVYSPVPIYRKVEFLRALRNEIFAGKYKVLHCHHDLMSALYLTASIGTPLEKRFVHVHNADEDVPAGSAWKRALLREPMRRTCLALADKIVGISNHTLDTFLRGRPRRPGRDLVHHYGIDSEPFLKAPADRDRFRRELGLPQDSLVMLFAGRLVPEKNPGFALDVLSELRKLEPRAVGVFVGSGSEEPGLRSRASTLGLKGTTRFLGWRTDIPEIMCCCDWFILPRPEKPMEGFGIAVVEAQLAGLRLMLSKGIADDPLLTGSCARRLSLADSASVWARVAFSQLGEWTPSREQAAQALTRSPMEMDRALHELLRLYEK